MSRRSLGARLSLEPARVKSNGVAQRAVWVIRDGRRKISTGFSPETCRSAGDPRLQQALANYIAGARKASRESRRHPSAVFVADVISIYLQDVACNAARPREVGQRAKKLLAWWGNKTLADVNGKACRDYVEHRANKSARRELEDLRAAINHHRREGLCSEVVEVVLPPRSPSRERWLTRSEAATLIWAAYRYREIQKGVPTDRRSRRHVARFILIGIYTGTRAGAICAAAMQPTLGRPWIDLERGVFYRRAVGGQETKKRQPPIKLPGRLLAHLRRWKRLRLCHRFAIEWNGDPAKGIEKAFARACADAKLIGVTPHTLRHTAASWGMQNGADHGALADYLGMTVEMLRRVYGHHDPDYLADARDAIVGRRVRRISDRNDATNHEQTSDKVIKIYGNH
jgi:integrase